MYFLKESILSIKRRYLSSLFMFLITNVLLFGISALGFWSYWILSEEHNFQARRSISLLLNTSKEEKVSAIHRMVASIEHVETVRTVPLLEVLEYMEKLGSESIEDIITPRILEVTLDRFSKKEDKEESIRSISSIEAVAYMDTGKYYVQDSRKSLTWLGYTTAIIAAILFAILVIISVSHFQNIFFHEKKEMNLIRSFGGKKYWILLPWMTEAFFYSLLTTLLCSLVFVYGEVFLLNAFNQFFVSIGYEKFLIDTRVFLFFALLIFLASFFAHSIGAFIAFLRSSLA